MAERDLSSAATAAAPNAAAADKKAKPDKPDEEAFKANLAKAEKEHAVVMERLVCSFPL